MALPVELPASLLYCAVHWASTGSSSVLWMPISISRLVEAVTENAHCQLDGFSYYTLNFIFLCSSELEVWGDIGSSAYNESVHETLDVALFEHVMSVGCSC